MAARRHKQEATVVTNKQAQQLAFAILACEDLPSIVHEQFDANPRLNNLTMSERKLVVKAARQLADTLHELAGSPALERVAGSDPVEPV